MTTAPTDAPALREFPCRQCGARLEFAPGTESLKCPYCGHENPIERAPDPVAELDYARALAQLESAQPRQTVERVKCGACAAEVDLPPNIVSLTCPYCGRPIVTQPFTVDVFRPRALLPFAITREQATDRWRRWIASRWFAPTAVRRESAIERTLNGLYIPAWTFDAFARSRYTGERGEAYYVPVTVRVGNKTTTQMQRRIRWYPASGEVTNRFDDLLVLATRSLPPKLADSLAPWDLNDLTPYREDYLAGFRGESAQIPIQTGFEDATRQMQPAISAAVRADIGGDEQRVHDIRSTYSQVTFKHILLPVWLSTYRFRNKVYQFLVNARTGEVCGDRPYSAWKIALAVLAGLVVAGVIAAVVASQR